MSALRMRSIGRIEHWEGCPFSCITKTMSRFLLVLFCLLDDDVDWRSFLLAM